MAVQPIPDGFTAITPYLIVPDVDAQLEFLKKAFGATVHVAMPGPGGKTSHAEVSINGAKVMMGNGMGQMSPMPAMLYVYVNNVDEVVPKAVAAGAKLTQPINDAFYGDRIGHVIDPHGNHWTISTHKEDVTPEQMKERMAKMMKKG